MEVDDLEGGLLEQFSSMQTIDRDELIQQMVRLVGANISNTVARFYLEMNQWNVQAAVCSYFDLESANARLPGMVFVQDITIGEGDSVPPKTRFVKTWRVQNTGPDRWPPGCVLRYCEGAVLSLKERVLVDPLDPYMSTDISVEMESPDEQGVYQAKWRMSTATGNFFGDTIWVIIAVESTGTLSITQQFSNLNQLGSPLRGVDTSSSSRNPFGPVGPPPLSSTSLPTLPSMTSVQPNDRSPPQTQPQHPSSGNDDCMQ